jgi:hypothetical protein
MKRFVKDKNANKEYQINWAPFLGADTIVGSPTWVPDENLWTALTSYRKGESVRLSGGAFLEALTSGVSASVAPTAPSVGSAVVDGTVTWLRSFNVEASTNTTTTATVWVSGGTVGREYGVINHVISNGGRGEDETLVFVIIDK